MRIGVMGGSFDPPHDGHLALARAAAVQLGLDRVLLVPAGTPPHKPTGTTLPAPRRLALVAAATAGDPVLEACDLEVSRPGVSYTADTLDEIMRRNPGADLWFILGADQLEGLPGWSRPGHILSVARLAVARRPGAADPEAEPVGGTLAAGRIDIVEMPEVPISSTLVRERLARGEDVSDLVPEAVARILVRDGSP